MKQLLIIILLLVQSCSWNQSKLQESDDSKAVMKYFEKKDDNLKKFEVKNNIEETNKLQSTNRHKVKKNKKVTSLKDDNASFREIFQYPENHPEQLVSFDRQADPIWPQFSVIFDINERIDYNVKFFAITVGKLSLSVQPLTTINNQSAYHFQASFVSAPFYRFVYEINDFIHSYVSTEHFSPIKYLLQQRESGQNIDDLQLFDAEKFKTYFRYRREKNNQIKLLEKDTPIPKYFQDSFSALYFTRGLPLKPGDTYKFPVITRGKVWLIKIDVIEKEKLWTELGQLNTVKVVAETEYQYPGDIQKKGKLTFWFEDNSKHHLVKFKGDIKIGSIVGEITKRYIPKP